MKKWWITLFALVFFVLVQSLDIWTNDMGPAIFLVFLILVIWFFAIVLMLAGQIFTLITKGIGEKRVVIQSIVLFIVVISTILFPFGSFSIPTSRADIVFQASREGAANCRLSVTLRADSSFEINDVCFGHGLTEGMYTIKNDTIHFMDVDTGRFGRPASFLLIGEPMDLENNMGFNAFLFKNSSDKEPLGMFIHDNDLDLVEQKFLTKLEAEGDCDKQYDTITNPKYKWHKVLLDKFYRKTEVTYIFSSSGDTLNYFVIDQDLAMFFMKLDPEEREPYYSLTNKVIYLILEYDGSLLKHWLGLEGREGVNEYILSQIENPVCYSIPIDSTIARIRKELWTESEKEIEGKRQIVGSLEKAKLNLAKK